MRPSTARQDRLVPTPERWRRLSKVIASEPLPVALVDLEAFERNVDRAVAAARAGGKRLRIATKSLRCPDLVDRACSRAGEGVVGLMTYTATETLFLAQRGARDALLAYPIARAADAEALVEAQRQGCQVAVVVDQPSHLEVLERAAATAGLQLTYVVELDLALRPLGLHLGVMRSPLRSVAQVVALVEWAAQCPHLRFGGVMGYESQIAGVTDASLFSPWTNPPKRWLKLRSRPRVEATRRALVEALTSAGKAPPLVNGGGTGSLAWSCEDPSLTEVTAGSAFIPGHLFDRYRDQAFEPASWFALQVCRRPSPGVATCHGGGWVASGEAGPEKLPRPVWPEGLKLLGWEGAGEVQTPLQLPRGLELSLGEPVFFRHAKSGELAEHVNEYLLVRGERLEARAPTYRGLGRSFLG